MTSATKFVAFGKYLVFLAEKKRGKEKEEIYGKFRPSRIQSIENDRNRGRQLSSNRLPRPHGEQAISMRAWRPRDSGVIIDSSSHKISRWQQATEQQNYNDFAFIFDRKTNIENGYFEIFAFRLSSSRAVAALWPPL